MHNKVIRRTRLISLFLIIVSVFALWHFVLGNRFGQPAIIQKIANETLDTKALIDQQTLSLQRRQRYLHIAQNEVDKLTQQFPSTVDAPGLETLMRNAATKAGVFIGPISESRPTVASLPATPVGGAKSNAVAAAANAAAETAIISVGVTATGTLSSVNAYILSLAHMQRAFVVNLVSYVDTTGTPVSPASDSYTATITGTTFVMKAIQPVPASLFKGVGKIATPGKGTQVATTPAVKPTPSNNKKKK
jgi:hypothetical protein